MANKPPAFQFYVKDWLSSESVVVMTAEQRGWYIQLLCHAWNSEPIATLPSDDRKLKALAGASDSWATDKQAVLDCFEVDGDRLVNRRLANQYQELQEFRNSKSEAGRKGNEKRWGKDRNGIAQQSLSDDSAIANDRSSVFTLQPSSVKGNVTVAGSKSDDSRVEQGEDQEPNLGETPNPHREQLTLTGLLKLDIYPAWLDQLLSESFEVRRKLICVAEWVDTKSTVWKGKPCLGLGGYRAMEKSYDKFYAKVPAGKKPHELLSSQATHIGGPRPPTLAEMVEGYSECDKTCTCAEPKPDCNGNDAFACGVSCVRCRGWLRLPNEVQHALTCTFLVNGSCSCGLDNLTEQLNDPKFQEWLESNAVPVNEGDPAPRSRAFEIED